MLRLRGYLSTALFHIYVVSRTTQSTESVFGPALAGACIAVVLSVPAAALTAAVLVALTRYGLSFTVLSCYGQLLEPLLFT